MAFIFMTKEEIRRRQRETMKIVKILDDVDWVYGPKARVKRHERSEWAQKALSEGTLQASGARPPKWIESRIEALPPGATLRFNLCETHLHALRPEYVPASDVFKKVLQEFGSRTCGVTFSSLVRHYIKEKFGGVQSRAAKAAWLDPQVVNHIHNAALKHEEKERGVSKRTVIALGLAFQLTLDEVTEFMRSAGYAFSDSDEDRLFALCFKRKCYRISDISVQLEAMHLKGFGH